MAVSCPDMVLRMCQTKNATQVSEAIIPRTEKEGTSKLVGLAGVGSSMAWGEVLVWISYAVAGSGCLGRKDSWFVCRASGTFTPRGDRP